MNATVEAFISAVAPDADDADENWRNVPHFDFQIPGEFFQLPSSRRLGRWRIDCGDCIWTSLRVPILLTPGKNDSCKGIRTVYQSVKVVGNSKSEFVGDSTDFNGELQKVRLHG